MQVLNHCKTRLAQIATFIATTPLLQAQDAEGLPVVSHPRNPHDVWMSFGLDRIPGLGIQFMGNPLWQYLAFLIYVVLAFYVSKFMDYLIQVQLKKWAAKTETKFDDLLLDLLKGPVKVISFVIFLHLGLRLFAWPAWAETFISNGTPGGTLWTFAKGRPERGETMEATALREVLEETGIEARVVRKIPLQLVGGTSMSEFFLMVPIQDHGVFDAETEAVVWATRSEAEDLISLTAKDRRRIRDLQLLDESYALFNCLPTRS